MSRVKVTVTLDVADTPHADAVTFFIYQYGSESRSWSLVGFDDTPEPEQIGEAVEAVVVDILEAELSDGGGGAVERWTVAETFVEAVEP